MSKRRFAGGADVAKETFSKLDHRVFEQLWHWAHYRHPHQWGRWRYARYWKYVNLRVEFTDGTSTRERYDDTRIAPKAGTSKSKGTRVRMTATGCIGAHA